MYKGYDKIVIKKFLKKNNFIFVREFKFPFIPFSDCVYINSKFSKKISIN